LQCSVHSVFTANRQLPAANFSKKGQSAKVTETFSENLTKSGISELNFIKGISYQV